MTFTAVQTQTWTLPRAAMAPEPADCWQQIVSGAGTQRLTVETARPVPTVFEQSSFGSGVLYDVVYNGHLVKRGNNWVGGTEFPARARTDREGSIKTEFTPLRPGCGNPEPAFVGIGSSTADCGAQTNHWTIDTEVVARRELSLGPGLNPQDSYEDCPLAGADKPLPELQDGEPFYSDIGIILARGVRAPLNVNALFNCSIRVIRRPLSEFTSRQAGPVVGFPPDYDPKSSNWPAWQSSLTVTGQFTYTRVGCGKIG